MKGEGVYAGGCVQHGAAQCAAGQTLDGSSGRWLQSGLTGSSTLASGLVSDFVY